MITKVVAKNFKGLDFEQDLGALNVIVGPNGSGKSARTQALQLAILGYLPQDQRKQPSVIYATHGTDGQPMTVGFEILPPVQEENGQSHVPEKFVRRYKPVGDGISHEASLNGKKLKEKEVFRVLADLGEPRVFDLQFFNSLSENRQIEFLLELWPPADNNLRRLENQMTDAAEKEKAIRADVRAARQVIEKLTAEKAGLHVSGTLAEVEREIQDKENLLADAKKDLQAIITEEMQKAAALEAKRKEEEHRAELERTKERLEFLEDQERVRLKEEGREYHWIDMKDEPETPIVFSGPQFTDQQCLAAFRRVMDALQKAGCDACAARIVLASEIRRLKEGRAA